MHGRRPRRAPRANTCDVPSCRTRVRPGHVMCHAHWCQTPPELRNAIDAGLKAPGARLIARRAAIDWHRGRLGLSPIEAVRAVTPAAVAAIGRTFSEAAARRSAFLASRIIGEREEESFDV